MLASRELDMTHPYRDLPDHQYWRRTVQKKDGWLSVDPVVETDETLKLYPDTKVATAGSCFAQHIARSLIKQGFHYLLAEPAPLGQENNPMYQEFSAAYGNVYTVTQLHQLMLRAYGLFHPDVDCWRNAKGRLVDPFRPGIREDGFETYEEFLADQNSHLKAVRRVFEECDVFIFTLGLTEGWYSKTDGAATPVVPGAVDCEDLGHLYEFRNARVSEMTDELSVFLKNLRLINPRVRVMLTVSPVSLIATYARQNVVLSNTYSKSALRVVAEETVQTHPFVSYFPSYEIISSHPSKSMFFEDDFRSVRPEGVEHVMRIFAKHHLDSGKKREDTATKPEEVYQSPEVAALQKEYASAAAVICDEERLIN
ncbi:GSCFA domain-containing protein [Phyllobacterium ifriqiyense]|uniref:GSCFA domain-containing protein n=1 Tax=Phyllobacterium ifriqiyense TaxID=314238 RepID=UPI003394806E